MRLSRVHGTWGSWGLQWRSYNLRQALWPVESWSHSVHHAKWLSSIRRPLWWRLWLGIRWTLPHLPGKTDEFIPMSFVCLTLSLWVQSKVTFANVSHLFTEHFIWEHPGRKIWVSGKRLGSHLLKCQRPDIQTSGPGCQKSSECQSGAAAPLGAGGESESTTMPLFLHFRQITVKLFKSNKKPITWLWFFRVHLTLCQHPSYIRGEKLRATRHSDNKHFQLYTCFDHSLISFPLFLIRTSSARDLTVFADKAMAVNRQLAEQDGMEEQQQQEVQFFVTASGSSMRLSPPSNSKLAKRRQRSSQPKGGPVSAAELRQLLAPLVIVGDCAWTFPTFRYDSSPVPRLPWDSSSSVLAPLWPRSLCYSGSLASCKGRCCLQPFL